MVASDVHDMGLIHSANMRRLDPVQGLRMEAQAHTAQLGPYDLETVAVVLGCSLRTLRRMVQREALRVRRLPGRRTVVEHDELERVFGAGIAGMVAASARAPG